jgi:LysM repeat protein
MNLVDSGSTSAGSHMVTGIAIIGVLLGGAGLYAALSGRGTDRAQDDRIAELEQRADRMSGALEELNGQIRGLHNNTRTALQSLNDQLNQMRQETRTARSAPAQAPAPAAAPSPSPAPASSAAAPTKTYTVRAGDLIAKIARDNNTTVDAILKANPGLNPNRIKVGQVINLP